MGVLCERVHVSVPVRVSPAFSSVLFLLFGPIQVWFCFILFYYSDDCFLMRERKKTGLGLDGNGRGRILKELREGEPQSKYIVWKKYVFNKRRGSALKTFFLFIFFFPVSLIFKMLVSNTFIHARLGTNLVWGSIKIHKNLRWSLFFYLCAVCFYCSSVSGDSKVCRLCLWKLYPSSFFVRSPLCRNILFTLSKWDPTDRLCLSRPVLTVISMNTQPQKSHLSTLLSSHENYNKSMNHFETLFNPVVEVYQKNKESQLFPGKLLTEYSF